MGLSAYAMIAMADGGEKRVEDLEPGDLVREAATGLAAAVTNIWQGPAVGMVRLHCDDGSMLDLTGDSLVVGASGPAAVAETAAGSPLLASGRTTVCADVEALPGDYMVYDVTLDSPASIPCLAANGIAVTTSREGGR